MSRESAERVIDDDERGLAGWPSAVSAMVSLKTDFGCGISQRYACPDGRSFGWPADSLGEVPVGWGKRAAAEMMVRLTD